MFAILTFLYVLCIQQGLFFYQKTKKKIPYKNYKNGKKYLAISVFRKGLSLVSSQFHDLLSFIQFLAQLLKDKSRPKWVYV